MSENQTIKIKMQLAKETKNTVRYNADPSDDSAAIDAVYLKKFALNGARPETIALNVRFEQ